MSIGETRLKLSLFKSSKLPPPPPPYLIFNSAEPVNPKTNLAESLMNISGPSIAAVCRKTVKTPASMVVLSDSLAHNVETLSVRLGGSANGHNGLKSIIAALGNQSDFHRFRIGIGRTQLDAATYVLAKMPTHERQFWANGRGYDMVLEELEKVARKVGP